MNWHKRANKRTVPLTGTLRQSKDGFVYLEVSNDIIHGLFSILKDEEAVKPPYFGEDGIGAHISVIATSEIEKYKLDKIEEIGKEFEFKFDKIKSVDPHGWHGIEHVWFIEVKAPSLRNLRKKYGLPGSYKNLGHKFHITFAVKHKK